MSQPQNFGVANALGSASADQPSEPTPPPNPQQELADQIRNGTEAMNTIAEVSSFVADPKGAIKDFAKSKALGVMDDLIPGFSEEFAKVSELASAAGMEAAVGKLTNNLAKALGPFPAATMTSMALGAPHAHVKHPPSGPPPVPPTPLPPLGPIMLGNCVQVLINSKPAARCG